MKKLWCATNSDFWKEFSIYMQAISRIRCIFQASCIVILSHLPVLNRTFKKKIQNFKDYTCLSSEINSSNLLQSFLM